MKSVIGFVGMTLLGASLLAVPTQAHAGLVGVHKMEGSCPGVIGNVAGAVTAAGHTPVVVNTLDAVSLAPLDALVISTYCTSYTGSAAVDTAVANGMALMLDTPTPVAGSVLPGDPALDVSGSRHCDRNLSLVAGAPIISGPGGTLTDDSLDVGGPGGPGGYCSITGTYSVASLPFPSLPFVVPTAAPQQAGAFGYLAWGSKVAVSISQWPAALPGGYIGSGQGIGDTYLRDGAHTYYANTVAWLLAGTAPPATTCATEGYTGTKLLWCQNVCEKGYTGATLQTWIHRWIRQFRDLPYCAAEPTNGTT